MYMSYFLDIKVFLDDTATDAISRNSKKTKVNCNRTSTIMNNHVTENTPTTIKGYGTNLESDDLEYSFIWVDPYYKYGCSIRSATYKNEHDSLIEARTVNHVVHMLFGEPALCSANDILIAVRTESQKKLVESTLDFPEDLTQCVHVIHDCVDIKSQW